MALGQYAEKFDYHYRDEELQDWVEERIPRMAGKARNGILFFNNHVRGQAPENARRMAELLSRQGFEVGN